MASGFVRVTRAWACVELGLDPGPVPAEPNVRLLAGAHAEVIATGLLARGKPDAAAERFSEAERLWHLHHERGRLRCAWATGEALRQASRTDDAVAALERAERLAAAYGHEPILLRARRSLRQAGVVRAAPRRTAARGLTAREAEVLALAGGGMTNEQIGIRLGIARPTVARTLRNARLKLGAETRAQAAVLAEEQ